MITPEQENAILFIGLESRDDGPQSKWRRWHLQGWSVGLCYLPVDPTTGAERAEPWGVYWGTNKSIDGMVWTSQLGTAVELLEWLSRVL